MCLYLLLFPQLPQKVVTSYDVLVLLQEMKDLCESATEAYFCLFVCLFSFLFCLFALFVFKERIFRLSLSACGLSSSFWGLMHWSFLEDAQDTT